VYSLLWENKVNADVLEIGSNKGRVTICLALALAQRPQEKVYALDANLWGTRGELLKTLNKYKMQGKVIPVLEHSAKASRRWGKPLKCIWVDTDLTYATMVSDFILWERYLAVGGMLMCAGAHQPGVKKMFADYVINSGRFRDYRTVDSFFMLAYKDKETPAYSRARLCYTDFFYTSAYCFRKFLQIFFNSVNPRGRGKDSKLKMILRNALDKITR
jgi:hypothetical protein